MHFNLNTINHEKKLTLCYRRTILIGSNIVYRFNAPSREAIYKAVMTLSEGESWTYDYEEFVAFDSKNIGSAKSRSAITGQTEDEIRQIQENHRKPVFVRGSWRNGRQNAKNNNIIVPLR